MPKAALKAIDDQIVKWIEQLDELYSERKKINKRIAALEERLSAMKHARRALALEWDDTTEEVPIPLVYSSEGVRDAIHEVLLSVNESLTVAQIVAQLKRRKYDFGEKNPRRVVNMALINDKFVDADGKGKYSMGLVPGDIPF